MKSKKLTLLLSSLSVTAVLPFVAASCTNDVDDSKNKLEVELNQQVANLTLTTTTPNATNAEVVANGSYGSNLDSTKYELVVEEAKAQNYRQVAIKAKVKDKATGTISKDSKNLVLDNLKLSESELDSLKSDLNVMLKSNKITAHDFIELGEGALSASKLEEVSKYVTITYSDFKEVSQTHYGATLKLVDKLFEDQTKSYELTFEKGALGAEEFAALAAKVTFSSEANAYELYRDGKDVVTAANVDESVTLAYVDDSFKYDSSTKKFKFKYKLTQKYSNPENISTEYEAEVVPASKALTSEEFDEIKAANVTVTLPEEKPTIEELIAAPQEKIVVDNSLTDYVSVEILRAEKLEDSSVNVTYKLKDVLVETVESAEYTVNFANLLTNAQRDLKNAEEATVVTYETATDQLRADELLLDKVIITAPEGYTVVDKAFMYTLENNKDQAIDEIDNGYKKVQFKLQKDDLTSSEFVVKELTTLKSSYEFIVTKLETVKKFMLVQSAAAKAYLSTLSDGALLDYDYVEVGIYDKPYNKDEPDAPRVKLFELSEEDKVKLSRSVLTTFALNSTTNSDERGKVILVKDEEGNYSIKFKLGKYDRKPANIRIDNKYTTTTPVAFTVLTQEELEAKAQALKDTFGYENKETTPIADASADNVTKGEVDSGLTYALVSSSKNETTGTLSLTYKLTQTDSTNTTISSSEINVEITGFKTTNLSEKLEGVTVDYENKAETLPSAVEVNNFMLKRGEEAVDLSTEGITVTKTVKAGTANNTQGTLTLVVALTKDDQTFNKEYDLTGFKQQGLDLATIAEGLTLDLAAEVNKTYLRADQVTDEQLTLTLDHADKDKVNLAITTKTPADGGNLTVVVTLTSKEDESQTHTKEFSLTGFSTLKAPQVKKAVDENATTPAFNVIGGENAKNRILSFFNATNKTRLIAALKNNVVIAKERGGDINKKDMNLEISHPVGAVTNGVGVENMYFIDPSGKGNRKGFELVKKEDGIYAEFSLLEENQSPSDKLTIKEENKFSIKIFDLPTVEN